MADPANVMPDAKSLLDNANSASEKVAVLHLGFMAVCAYLLVIVFGTTHLDLLFGKGIKLPFVDVEVPIAGFYTLAPYLLVLVHFNFLLQLQLLSRKLNAFNSIAPKHKWAGRLKDQLHGFPFTISLIGRACPIVHALLALMVAITVILLPLITLVAIQLTFLAYQEESITWAQRVAIMIDVGLIVTLWPLIMDPKDDWRAFWSRIFAVFSPKWLLWFVIPILFVGLSLIFFGSSLRIFLMGIGLAIFSPLPAVISFKRGHRREILVTLVMLVFALLFVSLLRTSGEQPVELWPFLLSQFKLFAGALWSGVDRPIKASATNGLVLAAVLLVVLLALFWKVFIQRPGLVFMASICFFPLLSLSIMVDGERMEQQVIRIQGHQQTQLCNLLEGFRHLYLAGQTLIAKQSAKPEVLTLIRKGNWQEALTQIEPLRLGKERKLRHAILAHTILTGAQLEGVDLQGADLSYAYLPGADLNSARLQGADLNSAYLQGAHLNSARLQGADLHIAYLQGADLHHARLQGADLRYAQLDGALLLSAYLQGANLNYAYLQGAELRYAYLQGADLSYARLQGALLDSAYLQGADLSYAQLQGAHLMSAHLQGANLKNANLQVAVLRGASLFGAEGKPLGDLVDAREIRMKPMSEKKVVILAITTASNFPSSMAKDRKIEIIVHISNLGLLTASTTHLDSCLRDAKESILGLECGQTFNASEEKRMRAFITKLHPMLTDWACRSTQIAEGLMKQAVYDDLAEAPYTRQGLETLFVKRISDESCPGLWGLSPEKKKLIQGAAKQGK